MKEWKCPSGKDLLCVLDSAKEKNSQFDQSDAWKTKTLKSVNGKSTKI